MIFRRIAIANIVLLIKDRKNGMTKRARYIFRTHSASKWANAHKNDKFLSIASHVIVMDISLSKPEENPLHLTQLAGYAVLSFSVGQSNLKNGCVILRVR